MELIYSVLTFSIILNAVSAFFIYKRKTSLTKDARQLLSELASGSAIIKVDVIDAAGMFYRSPRG